MIKRMMRCDETRGVYFELHNRLSMSTNKDVHSEVRDKHRQVVNSAVKQWKMELRGTGFEVKKKEEGREFLKIAIGKARLKEKEEERDDTKLQDNNAENEAVAGNDGLEEQPQLQEEEKEQKGEPPMIPQEEHKQDVKDEVEILGE